jgi:N-acetyl sugar amidotransferase
MTLKKCSKCDLPETYETIEYNEKSVCNICAGASYKNEKIDWTARKKLLDKIIEKNRDKSNYDCIVPFSGGKDSTFQLYYLINEYKLKPLVIRFNHGFLRETVINNTNKILKKLGVDFIDFTPNWKIVKKLMLESFKRKTDFCWHCHTGIFSYPLRMAIMQNVPLIFYGEPTSEFDSYTDYADNEIDYFDEKKFNIKFNLGITADDMFNMLNKSDDPIDKRDLLPYTFPSIKEFQKINLSPVALGSFIKWDTTKQTDIIKKELNWETDELEHVPKELNPNGEKIECFMQGTRDYIKWLKRGYSRMTQINSMLVRNNRMDPKKAKELNEKYDGIKPKSLEVFLEYVGMEESEFNEIINEMVIPPHKPNFDQNYISEKIWDFDNWYKENNKKK